ncbi:hypothetical protein EQG49_03460 [Periweissella cryptocerci]|uniref:Uncharacterized protein n=1 Tax=Periweissella cryptocerci TaxID=2506420 RepID=A0A4P6YSE2_9LACO|nr:hypothetical protein [Periweissella cryptocerci]QBO35581.1 hypothetical protein EQG49_03460 [Periweissella cryptocerci]
MLQDIVAVKLRIGRKERTIFNDSNPAVIKLLIEVINVVREYKDEQHKYFLKEYWTGRRTYNMNQYIVEFYYKKIMAEQVFLLLKNTKGAYPTKAKRRQIVCPYEHLQ